MNSIVASKKIEQNKKHFFNKEFILEHINLYKGVENEEKLLPLSIPKNKEETVFRKNGKSIDKIHEFDFATGAKIKTTHFDYFNDKKIRSIDEFDIETGKIIRVTNFILYKSVTEFDLNTGKKIRTINYNLSETDKISSIQEYDFSTEKLAKVYIYRKRTNTLSILKELNPDTGKVFKWTSYKEDGKTINSVSEYDSVTGLPIRTLYFYNDGLTVKDIHQYDKDGHWHKKHISDKNVKERIQTNYSKSHYSHIKDIDIETKKRMARLIDNLFRNKQSKFEYINV